MQPNHVSASVELTLDTKALAAEAALAAVRAHLPRVGLDEVVFLAEQVGDHHFTSALKKVSGAPGMSVTCELDGWRITASSRKFSRRVGSATPGESELEHTFGSAIRCVRIPPKPVVREEDLPAEPEPVVESEVAP